jgi:rhomboid family protein
MGIYDRDYIRREPPRPGAYGGVSLRGMRMWSATTWIIVICVLVFVVDAFLPLIPVEMGTRWRSDYQQGPNTVLHYTQPMLDRSAGEIRGFIYDRAAGTQPVGYVRYDMMHPIEYALHFSTERGFLHVEFWRLIGFQFLHSHGMLEHILFNMLGLFFLGPIVELYLGRKRYVAFYLLCGMCGAVFYALINLAGIIAHQWGFDVPGLLFDDPWTPLVGASAGVFGVVMAGAYLVPNATVLLFFVLPIRMKTLAYGLLAIAVITLLARANNAGGQAGHIGGAIAGWYFIRHAHHLHGFFDILGRVDPTSHHYRGRGRAARAGAVSKSPHFAGRGDAQQAAEVDRILDKIRTGGIHSLTDREKQILRKASED